MKAIKFLKENKISDYVNSEKNWFDDYQEHILNLYSKIEFLVQSKDKLNMYKDIYDLINYFENKHEEADIKLIYLGDFIIHDDEQLFPSNPNNKNFADSNYILSELEYIKDMLDKDIQDNKDYISSYLLDFNTYMCNYSLISRMEDLLRDNGVSHHL